MKIALSLIILITALAGCGNSQNYRPSNLTLLTPEQQIINARNHELPDPNTLVIKNQKGEILSIGDVEKLENLESYAVDYYQDEDGVVVEAVLRKLRESDKELHSIYPLLQDTFNDRILLFRSHNIEHDYYKQLAIREKNLLKKTIFL